MNDSDDHLPIMYHYTNCEGFKGIIKSRNIRLTQVNRTDDPLEATISKKEFVELLDYYQDTYECVNIIKKRINDDYINDLNNKLRHSQYAFSLTKMKDNPDHWKKYGDSGYGVCIGFNMQTMKPLLKAGLFFKWDMVNVVNVGYNINTFREMIDGKLNFINHNINSDMDLMIELLHRDIAIGKKSIEYSKYVETRLSFSDRNIVAAQKFINHIHQIANITKPSTLDSDLEKYLRETQIEKIEILENGNKYHSINYSSLIHAGIISEVIIGYNNNSKEQIKQFLSLNGINCNVIFSNCV